MVFETLACPSVTLNFVGKFPSAVAVPVTFPLAEILKPVGRLVAEKVSDWFQDHLPPAEDSPHYQQQ